MSLDEGVAMEQGHALKTAEAAVLRVPGADGRSLGKDFPTPGAGAGSGSFADTIALGGRVHRG